MGALREAGGFSLLRGLKLPSFPSTTTHSSVSHHLHPAIPWFNIERATKLAIETQVNVAWGFIDGLRQLAVAQD